MIIASYIAAMIALAYGAFLQLQIIQNEKQTSDSFKKLETEINKIKTEREEE